MVNQMKHLMKIFNHDEINTFGQKRSLFCHKVLRAYLLTQS